MAAPSNSAEPFRLLDLPTEIRLEIYRHALPSGGTFGINTAYEIFPQYHATLLRTNLQIKEEAEPIFFANNRFVFIIRPGAGPLPRAVERLITAEYEAFELMRRFEIHFAVLIKAGDNCSCVVDAHGRFEYEKKVGSMQASVISCQRGFLKCRAGELCRYATLKARSHEAYDLIWKMVKHKHPETAKSDLIWQAAGGRIGA